MKRIKYSLFALIGVCLAGVALSAVGVTRAWLSSGGAFGNQNLQASSVSNYFAAGDGSEEHPFIINTPTHMYNLSWLQARGIFDTTKTYFKVSDLNGNPVTIDFAGALTGTTNTTGALPPIGTDAHHFIGEFDGNGSVLKNVWVSSNPDDWKEKPIDIGDANTNTHVGFFGNIDQNVENKGVVKNFYLENIEVTSHVDSSFVGLVAGYSNSYTENIGVKNGKLSFRQGNQNNYKSEASLIGKVGDEVYWEDVPSDAGDGGSLKIDPNEAVWGANGNTKYTAVSNGNTSPVPGAFDGNAYIAGTMNASNASLTGVYKYNRTITFDQDGGTIVAATTGNSINAANNRTVCSGEFWKQYDASKSRAVTIDPTATVPSSSSTINVTANGNTFAIPRNSIWFKPKKGGKCGVSFTVGNMSGNRFASLYRFKRNANGTISSNWDEISLEFNKAGGVAANGLIVYYEIQITDAEIKDGYEYCIGYSKTREGKLGNEPYAKFFFLYLAGTDEHSGPAEGMALLKNIDYVYKFNGQYLPSFEDENYKPNHLKLIFDFNAETDDVVFLYNMEDIQNSTSVYYYSNGPVIADMVTYQSVGVLETTTTRFPARQQT